MFGRETLGKETKRGGEIDPGQTHGIDRLGRQIVRAAALGDEECDRVASSPMLYARIHAQIAADQAGGVHRSSWLGMILAAWRAIPVMAIIAVIAAAGFFLLVARPGKAVMVPERGAQDTASLYVGGAGQVEGAGPVSACSISSKEECGISTEDVLATMIDQGREDSGR